MGNVRLTLVTLLMLLASGTSRSSATQEQRLVETPVAIKFFYPQYGDGKFGEPVKGILTENDTAFIKFGVVTNTSGKVEDEVIVSVSPLFEEGVLKGFHLVGVDKDGIVPGFIKLDMAMKHTEDGENYFEYAKIYLKQVEPQRFALLKGVPLAKSEPPEDGPRGVDIGHKLGLIVGAIAGFIFLIYLASKRSSRDDED